MFPGVRSTAVAADDWVALGRRERERLATAAGGIDAPGETGRRDKYIEAYFGREYTESDKPREVITMAVQILFHPLHGEERLTQLARHDPEMLDLVIGMLYHFDP